MFGYIGSDVSGPVNSIRPMQGNRVLRILFVGDSSDLPPDMADYIGDLDGQLQVVADGNSAIAAVATLEFDVVVAAPALPDITPATLLGQIRTLRPATSRIALITGEHSQRTPPARIIGVAHRFLPTPLAPEVLLEAVSSLEELRDLLDDARLRSAIGRIDKLPSPPHLYLSLMHALEEDEDSDASDIAKLISGDPAIAAKVLQLCNSAFFSNGRAITDLRGAVTRLGISTLRDLVLASEVFSVQSLSGAERQALQQRALVASKLAAKMLPQSSAELGATAALLADIGLLLPGVRNARSEPAGDDDERPAHTEAGGYLLGLWGLPMPIIEAVAFQMQPQRSSTRSFWITGAVHVATALANGSPVDEAYLAKVGVLGKLDDWRELADELLGRVAA